MFSAGEADGRLALDRSTHGDPLGEAMTDQFALIDCLLKQQDLWLAHAGLKSLPRQDRQSEALDERRGTAGAAKAAQGQVP